MSVNLGAESVRQALSDVAKPEKVADLQRYFKTGPGGYAEGDRFIGVMVPDQHKIANRYEKEMMLDDLAELLESGIHEHRMTALFMLVRKFERSRSEEEKAAIVEFYLLHLDHVDNWDLVDCSAGKILGTALLNVERSLLYRLASCEDVWRVRVAVIAAGSLATYGQNEDLIRICEMLLRHPDDLIHKATGWMLREMGKRSKKDLTDFLDRHSSVMPRTMLRYSLEKLSDEERKVYLVTGKRRSTYVSM